jgi:hypothetical protein
MFVMVKKSWRDRRAMKKPYYVPAGTEVMEWIRARNSTEGDLRLLLHDDEGAWADRLFEPEVMKSVCHIAGAAFAGEAMNGHGRCVAVFLGGKGIYEQALAVMLQDAGDEMGDCSWMKVEMFVGHPAQAALLPLDVHMIVYMSKADAINLWPGVAEFPLGDKNVLFCGNGNWRAAVIEELAKMN